jgi:hypothetical protein
VEDGVRLSGQILDAVSGSPISDAIFATLKEGTLPETFQQRTDQILEGVKTDQNGNFTTTIPLRRGTTYGIIIVAKGYRSIDGTVTIDPKANAVLTISGLFMQPQ